MECCVDKPYWTNYQLKNSITRTLTIALRTYLSYCHQSVCLLAFSTRPLQIVEDCLPRSKHCMLVLYLLWFSSARITLVISYRVDDHLRKSRQLQAPRLAKTLLREVIQTMRIQKHDAEENSSNKQTSLHRKMRSHHWHIARTRNKSPRSSK